MNKQKKGQSAITIVGALVLGLLILALLVVAILYLSGNLNGSGSFLQRIFNFLGG